MSKQKSDPLSFRTYLLIATLTLSGGPLLLLSAYHFQSTLESIKLRSNQRDRQFVRAFARELSVLLEARVEVVKGLAASATGMMRALAPLDQERWSLSERQLIQLLQLTVDETRQRSDYFDFMYIARLRGESLAISPLYSPRGETYLGTNYRDRDYFRALVKTRSVAISQVQLGKRSQRPNIQIVAPIFDERDALIGLSEGSVDLNVVTEASRALAVDDQTTSPESGRLLVLDHLGKVIVDTSSQNAVLSRPRALNRALKLKEARADLAEVKFSLNDRQWLMSESSLEVEGDLEWRVILLRDEDQLKSRAWSESLRSLLPSFLLTLLILIAGRVFSRRISDDMNKLGATLDDLEEGRGSSRVDLQGYPRVNITEWSELFQHAHRFSVTLSEKQQNLERALDDQRRVNERQRSLLMALENLREGIEITDLSGVILYLNPTAQALRESTEITDRYSAHWRAHSSDLEYAEQKRQRLEEGEVWSGEYRVNTESADQVYQLTLSPQLKGGALKRVIVILRDITDERRQQAALKVSERLASIGSLASGIAHEVNNPLMYILANLEFAIEDIAQTSLPSEERTELISSLEQAKVGAEQVQEISKSLLNIAHQERSAKWSSLRESVERCLRLVKTEISHQSALEVNVNTSGYFYGSPSELSQVLMNLLHNALHAMQETRDERDPRLGVNVYEVKHQSIDQEGTHNILMGVIEISDTGLGISSEVAEKIFDPFFTTKQRGVGTGLGLSICQRIIHDMGGSLTFKSRMNVGTTFQVTVPLRLKPMRQSVTGIAPDVIKLKMNVSKAKVLVIDDVKAITEMLSRQLRRRYEVRAVNSGTEALKILEEQSFDVIVSDVMMPQMSGVEVYQRAVERWPELAPRFVFMTGGILEERELQFFERHQVSCLMKPCSHDALTEEIEDKLTRAAP